jgi:predicted TIM-barrel fold metal-dependent hydrolase
LIIDAHMHLGPIHQYYNYQLSLQDLLEVMDRLHIQCAISSHFAALLYGDLTLGVEESLRAYESSGGRILSYYIFNPLAAEQCLKVMERYPDRAIFKGIKIHPSWHGVPADDERYEVVWQYAQDNQLVLLSHSWDISLTNPIQRYSYPALFEKHLARHPQVRFIFAHSGGRPNGIREAARLGGMYKNAFFDIAGDIYHTHFIEYLDRTVGSERILFGSDYSMMDPRQMLGVVLGAEIGVAAKARILSENAARLFDIDVQEEG